MTNHSAIHGPAGLDRTEMVQFFLDEDLAAGSESWVIDLGAANIADWHDRASWVTTDLDGARRMLSTASTVDDETPVTVTIEDTDKILRDQACRVLTEQTIRLATVNLRLIVPDLTVASFGGSTQVRDAFMQMGSCYSTGWVAAS